MKINTILNRIVFWLLQLAKILTLVIGYLLLVETFSIIPTSRRSPVLKELSNILKVLATFPSVGGFALIVKGVRIAVVSHQRNGGWLISAGGLTVLGFAQWRGIGGSWLWISVAYVVIGLIIVICSYFTISKSKDT